MLRIAVKDQPLSESDFNTLMTSFVPFEHAPVIAVGVSGGPDSLALVYLVDRWACNHGGRAVGLTLDHGLRDQSAAEAAQVGRWLDGRGIEHHTLNWIGDKPTSAIQETARGVRREMLLSWCRDAGIVHLALAHHADDQAETYVMRLAHGSGPDGLAGMASVTESSHARIIRPLLRTPKSRLVATVSAMGHSWINDPSNDQDAFERIRVRKALAAMEETGAGLRPISRVMNDYATQRHELDAVTAHLVMHGTTFHAAGYAMIDLNDLWANGPVLGVRALSRVLMAIGGRHYAPARQSVVRLYEKLKTNGPGKSRTLGGCRLIPMNGGCLVCREQRNLPGERVVTSSGKIKWDNRFQLDLVADALNPVSGDLTIRPLGKNGWCDLVAEAPGIRPCSVPEPARYSLPALYHNDAIVQVPHLTKPDPKAHACGVRIARAQFMPPEPVVGALFPLA
jgi:tRNA(Ile)-lysidine synthase